LLIVFYFSITKLIYKTMIRHKKTAVVIFLSAAVIFIATTAMQTQQQEQPEYKNLKVLPKNISHEELGKVMDEWRDALGVRCNFCHARDAATNKNDFASDAKPEKLMARKMMEMTAKINKKYFKEDKKDEKEMMAAIACYTCHNGKAHPANAAPPRAPRTPGQGAPGGSATPPPTTPPTTPPSR
jgi:cytochrome c553